MSFPEQNDLHILEYNDTVYLCLVLQIQSYIIIHIRPVLDNWIQVVNKPKREAQGRGRYAMTINGVDAANGHLTPLSSSERPLACIFERRNARLTSLSRD